MKKADDTDHAFRGDGSATSRGIAFEKHRSMADAVREAIKQILKNHKPLKRKN
jgi:hypothetical protein